PGDAFAACPLTGAALPGLYCSPLTLAVQAVRAVLLASATAATLGFFSAMIRASHGEVLPPPRLACWITAVAPVTSTARKASSPALVMPPSLFLPAVE